MLIHDYLIITGSPFSLRVGSSRSRRHKESTPPVHGKTRSFDTDYNFARAGSPSTSPYGKHLSSGSASFDANTASRSTSSTSKYKSLETTNSKEMFQDNTDAVHHRLKYGGHINNNKDLSSKLHSTRISDSNENLTSASAMKSFSESTRQHHNQSVFNSSSAHESYKQQYSGTSSPYGNLNGNGYHGDLVVDGEGLGVVLINSQVAVTITSEFGQTSLDNVKVEVSGIFVGYFFLLKLGNIFL